LPLAQTSESLGRHFRGVPLSALRLRLHDRRDGLEVHRLKDHRRLAAAALPDLNAWQGFEARTNEPFHTIGL
jgi:hypothetical protein